MIEKDITIINFISKLKKAIDFSEIKIKDYWEADLCAIGFQKDGKLLYISSNNSKNSNDTKFNYELELLNELAEDKYEVLETGSNLTEIEMVNKFQKLLNIK